MTAEEADNVIPKITSSLTSQTKKTSTRNRSTVNP